jgi:methyl coenzyme M reductase beta subunit
MEQLYLSRRIMTTDIKKLLDEAFAFDEVAFDDAHGDEAYSGLMAEGAELENERIAPLAKEIIVELVEELDKVRKGLRYAIDNAKLGGPANFILSSKEIDLDLALAKVEARLRGMK